ncbi:MAG: hypothetical protein V9F46_00440 [Chitinophagaceae bacterium]
MSQNLKDILSNLSTDIDQETLLHYLQGKLSEEQKHEVETKLMNDDFENDAVEGLDSFKDKEQIQYMVDMLNLNLKKKTEKKKKLKEKMKLKDQPWLYISVLIIILLIVLSYIVINRLLNK